MQNTILKLQGIYKKFGDTPVLKGIDLEVETGEFITLLGPSGCGKTTSLRIIAGLEDPDQGKVLLQGVDVTNQPPNLRDVNMVFQNYALFPHMNVAENIAYSQKLKKVPKQEIQRRVSKVLELVQLQGYENRKPNQLSGGQRQRVAIARAVINRPKVLLLDEPLGALDMQLRQQMQAELKELQKRLGITFVYITHDQEEALNMSDRIAVMKQGLFEQIGTPMEIYNNPVSSYVAEFVGSANILTAKIDNIQGDTITFKNKNGCGLVKLRNQKVPESKEITIAIRGENIELDQAHSTGHCCLPAVVKERNFAGGSIHIVLKLADGSEIVSYHHGFECPVQVGDPVCATWQPQNAVIVDEED